MNKSEILELLRQQKIHLGELERLFRNYKKDSVVRKTEPYLRKKYDDIEF